MAAVKLLRRARLRRAPPALFSHLSAPQGSETISSLHPEQADKEISTNRHPKRTFLQVSTRWRRILDAPESHITLWREVVVDFGHELITAVHTPVRWSDRRPSDDEFREAFSATRLSAARILSFVTSRARHVHRVVLANSEGYWSDDGDFVNLAHKHSFSLGHLGLLLGLVAPTLTDLVIAHCNDLLGGGGGALATIACGAPRLKVLRIEEVHCRLDAAALAELAVLTDLEELSITAEETMGAWAVGMDAVPEAWTALTKLKRVELRGHTALASLPGWLADLPALEHLDIAGCVTADVSVVSRCTRLRVLSLQSARLADAAPLDGDDGLDVDAAHQDMAVDGGDAAAGAPGAAADGAPPADAPPPPPPPPGARRLPDLSALVRLESINLADNALSRVPPILARLPALRHVDLSSNGGLRVPSGAPLAALHAVPTLTAVDLRGVHADAGLGYWSDAKCATMRHVSAFAKAARRRARPAKVLFDVD